MTKRTTLVAVILLTASTVFGQKIFKDFNVIPSPRADENIVGKEMQSSGTFVGKGTKFIERYPSYENYSKKVNRKAELDIEATIKKMITAKLGISDTSYNVTLANSLEIVDCYDYSQIEGLNGNRTFVISAVVAKEFKIEKGNFLQSQLKTELADSSQLKKIFDDASLKISFDNNSATIKSGKELVFAIKTITVTKAEPIDLSVNPDKKTIVLTNTSGNQGDFIDIKPFKGNIHVTFNSYDPIKVDIAGSESNFVAYRGCIEMKWTHNIYQPKAVPQVLCPDCNTEIIVDNSHRYPDCNYYRPANDYKSNNEFEVIRKKISKKKIAVYTATLRNLKVGFVQNPLEGQPSSNFQPSNGSVTCDIYMGRIIYTIKNDW